MLDLSMMSIWHPQCGCLPKVGVGTSGIKRKRFVLVSRVGGVHRIRTVHDKRLSAADAYRSPGGVVTPYDSVRLELLASPARPFHPSPDPAELPESRGKHPTSTEGRRILRATLVRWPVADGTTAKPAS